MTRLVAFASGALVGALIVATVLLSGILSPSCPTEDSCYVDYHDGQWRVVEGERAL